MPGGGLPRGLLTARLRSRRQITRGGSTGSKRSVARGGDENPGLRRCPVCSGVGVIAKTASPWLNPLVMTACFWLTMPGRSLPVPRRDYFKGNRIDHRMGHLPDRHGMGTECSWLRSWRAFDRDYLQGNGLPRVKSYFGPHASEPQNRRRPSARVAQQAPHESARDEDLQPLALPDTLDPLVVDCPARLAQERGCRLD